MGLATPLVATPLESANEAAPEPLAQEGTPALDATLIQEVPEGTFGPYVGGEGGRTLALWAAAGEAGERHWYSARLDPKGAPVGRATQLGAAPPFVTLARIRATPRGFIALASSPLTNATRIEALSLGASGELAGTPVTISQSPTEILWLEALVVGGAPIALWAAMANETADVYLAPLPAAGSASKPIVPVRVLEGATAWQATAFGDGIAVAATLASDVVRVAFVDASGRPLAQTDVQSGVRLRPEIDAARVGETLVVAWLQRDSLDERVYLAGVGTDSRVVARPEPAAPFGSQRLFGILPAVERRGDGFLVWENLDSPAAPRVFQLARVSPQARLGPRRAKLEFFGAAHERPEIVRHRTGIAALTRAPACARGAACTSENAVSTFVELGGDGAVLASEPLRLAGEAPVTADLAWGLHCGPEGCMALAAREVSPVPIYGVELRARSDVWQSIATWEPETLPRALRMDTIADGDPLADVAAAPMEDGFLVASLAQFDESTPYVRRTTPAPDGRLAPLRARLSVQPCDSSGSARGEAQVISYRARSTAGVALVRAPENRALLAWTALDKQRPEVFATLLGQTGKPLSQRMLTTGAGEVSALAAGALSLGFTLGWIAERGADPQLYATRVSSDLGRAAPDRQLSQPPGAARALSLMVFGAETWIAWVQARPADQALWLSRLDSHAMTRASEDVQLHQSAAGTLLSPTLVPRADAALLAWIERPKLGNSTGARAWIVELGGDGRPKGAAAAIGAVEDPAAIRLFCANTACQGVLDARPPGSQLIAGFEWPAGGAAEARELARRGSSGADPAAFALSGAHVFYADRQRQRGSLRRLEVSWR